MYSDAFSYASLEYFFIASKALLALVGFALNWALIYVTIRAKWLHSLCNVLLALYALGLSAYGFSSILSFLLTTFQVKLTSIGCFCAFGPLLGLFSASFVFMLAIAGDRLLAVLVPLRYKLMDKGVYLFAIVAIAFAYATYYLQFAFRNALAQQSDQSFSCKAIYATLPGEARFSLLNATLEVCTLLIYSAMGVVLKKKSDVGTSSERAFTRRIYKSLFAVTLVGIFGLFVNTAAYFGLQMFGVRNLNPNRNIPLAVAGYFGLVSCCADAVIFYKCSNEYKRAFRTFIGPPDNSVQVFGVGVQQVHPANSTNSRNNNNNSLGRRSSRMDLLTRKGSDPNTMRAVNANSNEFGQNIRRSM